MVTLSRAFTGHDKHECAASTKSGSRVVLSREGRDTCRCQRSSGSQQEPGAEESALILHV